MFTCDRENDGDYADNPGNTNARTPLKGYSFPLSSSRSRSISSVCAIAPCNRVQRCRPTLSQMAPFAWRAGGVESTHDAYGLRGGRHGRPAIYSECLRRRPARAELHVGPAMAARSRAALSTMAASTSTAAQRPAVSGGYRRLSAVTGGYRRLSAVSTSHHGGVHVYGGPSWA
jgi:hypothetical protein